MGVYQPSSGSLYPALRRLEAKGLVKALNGTGESARHRRVYEPTQAGRAAHATWLHTPVEVSTVSRDLGLHLMRFVMMEHASSREEVLSFLDDLKDALAAFTGGWSGTRRPPPSSTTAIRAWPWTTAWRSTAPAFDGPGTPSPRSAPLLPPPRGRRLRSRGSRRGRPSPLRIRPIDRPLMKSG
jgi:DNA-binding PadR family transcriptional regulator